VVFSSSTHWQPVKLSHCLSSVFSQNSSSNEAKVEVAPVEVLEELTYDEERDRHYLERKVESAFREAAVALKELRARRLYRSTHKTFEEYCRDRFGFSRSRSYQLIDAAVVVENLEKCPQFVDILPTNEAQCRWLLNLEPEAQRTVWSAVAESGQRPTGAKVKQTVAELEAQGIVQRLKAKPLSLAKDYCQVGDVFTLVRLEGQEKKYNGCWAIAVEPRDFTVLVDVHDASLTVKPENLDKIDSPDAKRQLPQVLKRIRRVREVPGFRDRLAYTVLEHLGRQTYLTPLEDKVLRLIEQEYGVEDYDC
jgi:hypothetical protein